MKHLKFAPLAALLLAVSACGPTKYEPPKDDQPHAVLKLKFKYQAIAPGTTVGARMYIRHDAKSKSDAFEYAYNQNFGEVNTNGHNPEIPMTAVNVRPGKTTDVQLAVYFFWYTTQTYTVMVNNVPQFQTRQVYNERACTAQLTFTPEAGQVYLLDYSDPEVDRDCMANAYQQGRPHGNHFKLAKVASSTVVQ
jgi:hypothetical protein